MPTSKSNELILKAKRSELFIEPGNSFIIKMLLPVERRRAIVGKQLSGELFLYCLCKFLCFSKIWFGTFKPEQISVGSISKRPCNHRLNAFLYLVISFAGSASS